jgi:hypothetical protein
MPVINPFTGMPGVSSEKISKHRTLGGDGYFDFLPGGLVLDGSKTRDPDNPDYAADGAAAQRRLRAGLLLGIVTATGEYANSIIGAITGAVVATGTSVTLSSAQAVELVRRVGSTGTLRFIGPPTAGGTVATFTETYSAVNTGTGVVTVSALNADLIAGSFVAADDGSYIPRTFLPPGWEMIVPEDSSDLPLAQPPISGNFDSSQLLPWPSDASLKTWIRDQLQTYGNFVFTDKYAA